VRELENTLERAYALCEDDTIRARDLELSAVQLSRSADDDLSLDEAQLPESQPPRAAGQSLETYLEDIEKGVILEALEATRWNKTAAAKRLGITFRALRYRLKKLRLE
jgi:two-component system response regulator PilR (NtrC family)